MNLPQNSRPIISLGDLVADVVVSIPTLPVEADRHQLAEAIHLEPGGGANFLIAGARLDYPMAAIGVLGDDLWGHQVAVLIRSEGVDLSQVQHNGSTNTVIVLVSHLGEHVFLGKYGEGSKIELDQAKIELIQAGGALYCAGYTFCEDRLVEMAFDAMRLAKESGISIFFDPGPDLGLIPTEMRQQILPLIDILFTTEDELALFSSNSLADLMKTGPDLVVVKRGAAGCAIYTTGKVQPLAELPGYPVQVIDTTAAGDSFNAAFMVAWLWDWPPVDCARLANVVGAAKVRKLGGGRNVPTLKEITQLISEFETNLNL